MKTLFILFLIPSVMVFETSHASPQSDEGHDIETQTSEGITLPAYGLEDARESFDIRIWPEGTVFWLEQENLRDMIQDPSIPKEERDHLKQVLAHQKAWRTAG